MPRQPHDTARRGCSASPARRGPPYPALRTGRGPHEIPTDERARVPTTRPTARGSSHARQALRPDLPFPYLPLSVETRKGVSRSCLGRAVANSLHVDFAPSVSQ